MLFNYIVYSILYYISYKKHLKKKTDQLSVFKGRVNSMDFCTNTQRAISNTPTGMTPVPSPVEVYTMTTPDPGYMDFYTTTDRTSTGMMMPYHSPMEAYTAVIATPDQASMEYYTYQQSLFENIQHQPEIVHVEVMDEDQSSDTNEDVFSDGESDWIESDVEIDFGSDEEDDDEYTGDFNNNNGVNSHYANKLMDQLAILNKKFRLACKQVTLLNNELQYQESLYNRAEVGDKRGFKNSIKMRMECVEGVRDMFYEYTSRKADELDFMYERMVREGIIDESDDFNEVLERDDV